MTHEPVDDARTPWTLGQILKLIITRLAALMRSDSGLASTVQTLVRSGLILGLNFATGILTARLLGPSGRGEQTAMMVWPQLFSWALIMGLPSALIYTVKSMPEHRDRIVSTALFLGFGAGCVAGSIGAAIVPLWLHKYDRSVVQFAQWAMVVAPLGTVSTIIGAALQAADRFRHYNRIIALAPISTLAIILIFLATGHLTPMASAFAYLVPIVPLLIYGTIALRGAYAPKFHFHLPTAKIILFYGVRVWLADLMRVFSGHLERAVLVSFLAPSSLGLYVVAQSLVQPMNMFHESVSVVLFPKAAGRTLHEVKKLAGLTLRVNAVTTATAALVLSIAAPFLLGLFYGPEFVAAAGPFRILAAEVVLFAINWLSVQVFISVGRPGVVAVIEGLGMALFAPMVFLLVPILGVEGAALAWLANSALRLVAIYACFPIILKTSPIWPIIGKADLAEIATRLRRG